MAGPNYENAYPEPDADHSALDPYPYLNRLVDRGPFDSAQTRESFNGAHGIEISPPVYLELANAPSVNPPSDHDAQVWPFSGDDSIGYGVPAVQPQSWNFYNAQAIGEYDDEDEPFDDADVIGRPKDNQFLHSIQADRESGDDDFLDETDVPSESEREDTEAKTGSKRGRVDSEPVPKKKRGWKQLLKGTSHDPALNRDDPRRARGTGRRARGRMRKEKLFNPGREFVDHLRNANSAYARGDFEESTEEAILAVKANPEIVQAHVLLSESLEKLGRFQDATSALMYCASITRDSNMWMRVADRTLLHCGDQPSDEDLDQALFCYSTAVKLQPDMYEARESKLDVLMKKQDWAKARLEVKALNRLRPGDIENKKLFAELCVLSEDLGEMEKAKTAYESAFEAQFEKEELPDDPAGQWSHLNMYLDLVERIGEPAEGISKLKQMARWILGRKHETFWDMHVSDDCEFDDNDERRRNVPGYQGEQSQEAASTYGAGLPLELRVKCGIFRTRMGTENFDEAMRHFRILYDLVDEIGEYYDMFYQAAEALRLEGRFEQAIEFYKPILTFPDIVNLDLLIAMAECHTAMKNPSDAIDCLEQAYAIDKDDTNVRLQLMKAYEANGQQDAVLKLAQELKNRPFRPLASRPLPFAQHISDRTITPTSRELKRPYFRRALPRPSVDSSMVLDGRKRRTYLTQQDIQQITKDHELTAFRHIAELKHLSIILDQQPDDHDVIQQWLTMATVVVALFRSVGMFYPKREMGAKNRNLGPADHSSQTIAKEMLSLRNRLSTRPTKGTDELDEDDDAAPPQIESNLPADFLNIAFSDWHRVLVQYALLTARIGKRDLAYDTVQNTILKANVFYYNKELHKVSLAAAICIANIYNDHNWLHHIARRFITSGEYIASTPFQFAAGLARLCYGSNYIAAGPSQKFMLRMLKLWDSLAMTAEWRNKFDFGNLWRTIQTRVERYGDELDLDPGLFVLYGHQVSAASQSYTAIPYYLRAYTLKPDSACNLLSMAVIQIQNGMKRQTDNRHYWIASGLAFHAKYCDLRKASGKASHLQEMEYNTGRIWHALGLLHLAMPCYLKVLDLSDEVRVEEIKERGHDEEVEDFAPEAALALQSIYCLSGNNEAAMRITERWLVI